MAYMPPGYAQNAASVGGQQASVTPAQDVTPSPAILAAFKAFPKGGDLLSKSIEEIIVTDPKLAAGVAKYVQTAPDLNKDQKLAALRGLAAALNRLGIQAADMPVKAPPRTEVAAPPEFDALPLVALAAFAGIACLALCFERSERVEFPVSP